MSLHRFGRHVAKTMLKALRCYRILGLRRPEVSTVRGLHNFQYQWTPMFQRWLEYHTPYIYLYMMLILFHAVYACMCIYIYAHICMHAHIHIEIHIHTSMHMYVCTNVCICALKCVGACFLSKAFTCCCGPPPWLASFKKRVHGRPPSEFGELRLQLLAWDPKVGPAQGSHNLHHRSITVQNFPGAPNSPK